jgi:hypothetical protein
VSLFEWIALGALVVITFEVVSIVSLLEKAIRHLSNISHGLAEIDIAQRR